MGFDDEQEEVAQAVLYQHVRHPHETRNVNELHKEQTTSLNDKIALLLTRGVSTMWCAYIFMILAMLGFPGVHATSSAYVQWVSQTFIQLVMLAVIMKGQGLSGKHQELLAEESFHTTVKAEHNIEQMMNHLNVQDEKILAQKAELLRQTQMLALILKGMEHSRSRIVRQATSKAKKESITQEVEAVLFKGKSA